MKKSDLRIEMKRSDLKTGMILELRSEDICMVLLGVLKPGNKTEDIVSGKSYWCPLDENFGENLENIGRNPDNDIVAVYQPKSNMHFLTDGKISLEGTKKIWSREPVIKIGSDEVEFMNGHIKVGCQEIPNDKIRKIVEKLRDGG